MRFSLFRSPCEHDEFIIRGIFISESDESIDVFIDRSFPDITATRIWELYEAKSSKKWREKQDTGSDFFRETSIHILSTHLRRIKNESISFELYIDIQALDNLENTENIADSWDISQGGFLKKEG